jgi:hypothetical protein
LRSTREGADLDVVYNIPRRFLSATDDLRKFDTLILVLAGNRPRHKIDFYSFFTARDLTHTVYEVSLGKVVAEVRFLRPDYADAAYSRFLTDSGVQSVYRLAETSHHQHDTFIDSSYTSTNEFERAPVNSTVEAAAGEIVVKEEGGEEETNTTETINVFGSEKEERGGEEVTSPVHFDDGSFPDEYDSLISNTFAISDYMVCPLTRQLFRYPVVASDGITYELSAITDWVASNGTSPTTSLPMGMFYIPNTTLRHVITHLLA